MAALLTATTSCPPRTGSHWSAAWSAFVALAARSCRKMETFPTSGLATKQANLTEMDWCVCACRHQPLGTPAAPPFLKCFWARRRCKLSPPQ